MTTQRVKGFYQRKLLSSISEVFSGESNIERVDGSGLGLYLSRLILLKENGNILAESEEGKGSCFTVFLKLME